jgi:hypothetical protein
MAELRESSGLLSLAALREHEKRQIQQQTEASRARAEAEQRARIDAERIDRERQRIEQAASELAEVERRAELSRLEAARASELERAEGATRAREELQVQLAEERGARRAAEISFAARLQRPRLLAVFSSALCLATGLAAAALYFGSIRPEAARARLAADRSLADEHRARVDADEGNARSARRNEELSRRLSSLDQALRERPPAAPEPAVQSAKPQKLGTNTGHGVTTSLPPCRDDGDPLNPCLKR